METGKIVITDKVYFEPDDEKRLVEVSNVFWHSGLKEWLRMINYGIVKNNASCKAEVNGTATIIELL